MQGQGVDTWTELKALATATGDVADGRTTIATGVLDEIANGTQSERDYVALAVHMKEEAGNVYQNKHCIIDITISATQQTAELDGFNSDEYDKQAQIEEVVFAKKDIVKKTVDSTKDTVFTSQLTLQDTSGTLNTTVTIPKEATAFTNGSNSKLVIEADNVILANNTFTVGTGTNQEGAVGAIDLTAYVNDESISNFKDSLGNPVTVKVETYTAKNLTNVTLNYESENWTEVTTEAEVVANKFYYEKTTGRLVFGTTIV